MMQSLISKFKISCQIILYYCKELDINRLFYLSNDETVSESMNDFKNERKKYFRQYHPAQFSSEIRSIPSYKDIITDRFIDLRGSMEFFDEYFYDLKDDEDVKTFVKDMSLLRNNLNELGKLDTNFLTIKADESKLIEMQLKVFTLLKKRKASDNDDEKQIHWMDTVSFYVRENDRLKSDLQTVKQEFGEYRRRIRRMHDNPIVRSELHGDLINPINILILKDGSFLDSNNHDNRKQLNFEQSFNNIPRLINGEKL